MNVNKPKRRHRYSFFLKSGITLGIALLLCIGTGFAVWVSGGKSYFYNEENPVTAGGGSVVEIDDALAFFAMSKSDIEGESLSYLIHTAYSYETTSDAETGVETTTTTETTEYKFISSTVSTVMNLDRASDNLVDLFYDDPSFYALSLDFKVYEYRGNVIAAETTVESQTISWTAPSDDLDHPSALMKFYQKVETTEEVVDETTGETSSITTISYNDVTELVSTSFLADETVYVQLFPYGTDGTLPSDEAMPNVYANDVLCEQIEAPDTSLAASNSYWFSFSKTAYATSMTVCWDLTEDYMCYLDQDSPATIRPHNLPIHEFDLTASVNYSNKWYFLIKSSQDMSLYSLFNYDHSYEANATDKNIPLDFCFNFNDPSLGTDLLNSDGYDVFTFLNRHPSSTYCLSFSIISQAAMNELEATSESEVTQ